MPESGALAYFAVGSNIRPAENILAALERLLATPELRLFASSTFYRTVPLDRPEQPDYRNGVWAARTALPPRTLKFEVLRPLEDALGRVRTADRHAPRPLDLDLILCGETVIDEPGLVLPDPDIRTRAFVAWPLRELAPDLLFPDDGATLAAVADALPRGGMAPDAELTALLRKRLQP